MKFLLPNFIADGENVYYAHNVKEAINILGKYKIDYLLIDVENFDFDSISFCKIAKSKFDAKIILYSYHNSDNFCDLLEKNKISAFLSKNIHPESIYIKIKSIIYGLDENFIKKRRKYFRVDIEPTENAKLTLYLPTIKKPVSGFAEQISQIGISGKLNNPSDYSLFREGTFLSKIFVRLNGYRIQFSGKVIKKSSECGLVIMFNDIDNFCCQQISRYIYEKVGSYKERLEKEHKQNSNLSEMQKAQITG